jgi:hypothetical protein
MKLLTAVRNGRHLVLCVAVLCLGNAGYGQQVTFQGRPFIPSWGPGTLLRANDADPVYVVDQSNNIYHHLVGPAWFDNCHRPPSNIIRVFSQALHSPGLQEGSPFGTSQCVAFDNASIGGFQELFEPGSNGARHIGMTAWTDVTGTRMQGIIRYESDTNLKGVCGGAVVVLVDSANRVLQYYTPPTGCGDGKFGGHANQRFVGWEDTIPPNARGHIAQIRVGVIFTQGRNIAENTWSAIGSVADIIRTASEALAATGH